jgi:hypothetical protein
MDTGKLRSQSLGLLTMLSIQFILGMVLNLFVELPKNASVGSILSHGGVVLVLHILVAVGLLLGSLALIFRASTAHSKSWLIASIIGALGVFVALTNGLAFIFNDDDVTSFIMALSFIVAATAYSTTLSFAEHPEDTRQLSRSEKSKGLNARVRHSHS